MRVQHGLERPADNATVEPCETNPDEAADQLGWPGAALGRNPMGRRYPIAMKGHHAEAGSELSGSVRGTV